MADFFDKMRYGVDRGILIVSVRSRELVNSVKIKNHLGELRRKKRNALEDLGSAVYGMFQNGRSFDEDKVGTQCELITELDRQIAEREEELRLTHVRAQEALKDMKALHKPKPLAVCECGREVYDENIKFCGTCFRKIEYKEDAG